MNIYLFRKIKAKEIDNVIKYKAYYYIRHKRFKTKNHRNKIMQSISNFEVNEILRRGCCTYGEKISKVNNQIIKPYIRIRGINI